MCTYPVQCVQTELRGEEVSTEGGCGDVVFNNFQALLEEMIHQDCLGV